MKQLQSRLEEEHPALIHQHSLELRDPWPLARTASTRWMVEVYTVHGIYLGLIVA